MNIQVTDTREEDSNSITISSDESATISDIVQYITEAFIGEGVKDLEWKINKRKNTAKTKSDKLAIPNTDNYKFGVENITRVTRGKWLVEFSFSDPTAGLSLGAKFILCLAVCIFGLMFGLIGAIFMAGLWALGWMGTDFNEYANKRGNLWVKSSFAKDTI